MNIKIQGFPWKRAIEVGKPFWMSEHKWSALAYLAGAIGCVIAKIWLNVYINDNNGTVIDALKAHHADEFWWYFSLGVGLIVLLMPADVMGNVFRTTMQLKWRKYLSEEYFGAYFAGLAAVILSRQKLDTPEGKKLANPEWRMTAEADQYTNISKDLFFNFFDAFVTIGTMGYQLWKLSPMLTGVNIAWALGGSVVVYFLGIRLVQLTAQQQQTDADLRAGLTEARNAAETIANYRAQEVALGLARVRLARVIDTWMDIMRVNRNMQFFTSLYYPLAPIIPLGIMGWLMLQDPSLDIGSVTRAQGYFAAMFGGMSVLVGNFGGISAYTAYVDRLWTMMQFLKTEGVKPLPEGKFIRVVEGKNIAFNEVSITSVDGTSTLVDKMTLALEAGESALIRGPITSTKTTLLNAIMGTYPYGNGTLTRPLDPGVMIISHEPFMEPMSLRTALSYPAADKTDASDSKIAEVLKLVDLELLLVDKDGKPADFDKEENWQELLSPSRRQRLALARVILKKPMFCLVEEGMEAENQKLLYTLFKTLGTTYLTAGNGTELLNYHSFVLEIGPDGKVSKVPASNYEPKIWRHLERFVPKFLLGSSETE